MKNIELESKINDAIWVAHSLFDRGKTSGSSANMSFRHGDSIYITASGSCFGTLSADDIVPVSMDGKPLSQRPASKEWPLHTAFYSKSPDIQAVIHTHSTYSVLWSFVPAADETDVIPPHTPYLAMKVGKTGFVPYEKPGSAELFKAFRERLYLSNAFILKNHGPVAGGRSIMDAFYALEELEESARVAWELKRAGLGDKQ